MPEINQSQLKSTIDLEDPERTESILKYSKDPVMLALYLLQDNASIISCQGTPYIYNGKCYDFIDDKALDGMYLSFCIRYGITMAFKMIGIVLRAFAVYPDITRVEKMNDYPNLLCLNNGILNIHTKEFIPHSSTYYFDSAVNVDYDPNATQAPNFVAFLNHTFNGEQDTIANIIRLGGYLLDPSNAAHKMFMFNGPGGSGKSTLLDVFSLFFVESMIPHKNQITSLSLEKIASGTFDSACLLTSRLNLCAETKRGHLETDEIKKIVSGDIITIPRKYLDPVNFRPKLKIIVACNGLPTFKDTSEGIYRRLVVIEFTNQYKTDYDYSRVIQPEMKGIYRQDPTLKAKLFEERSAILNLFIGGLIDLKNNNYQFSLSASSQKALDVLRRESDSCREYLEDAYEIDQKAETTMSEIYQGFRIWYRQNVQDQGAIKLRTSEMAKRIKETFGVSATGRKQVFNNETQRYERLHTYPLRNINDTMSEDEKVDEQIKAML